MKWRKYDLGYYYATIGPVVLLVYGGGSHWQWNVCNDVYDTPGLFIRHEKGHTMAYKTMRAAKDAAFRYLHALSFAIEQTVPEPRREE